MKTIEELVDSLYSNIRLTNKKRHYIQTQYHEWNIDIAVISTWFFRRITITSRRQAFLMDFKSCKLRKAYFLSLFYSDNYSIYGTKSVLSDILLESPNAAALMYSSRPYFRFHGKTFEYRGSIKKKDKTSLTNILILNQEILKEIEEVWN